MSHAIICDGCSAIIAGEPATHGYAIKRHYCEKCAEVAKAYEDQVDEAHSAMAKFWDKTLTAIRADHGKQLKALPDV